MKRIVSVSLGSSSRDHKVVVDILGEQFSIERVGTDGDLKKVIAMIKDLDGRVDAFGMGGTDLYLYTSTKRYTFRETKRIAEAASKTPIVDGSGLKNTLERRVIRYLNENTDLLLGKKVLVVSGLDRFGMAEALEQSDCEVAYGDVTFTLGVPVLIRNKKTLDLLAGLLLPLITQLPIKVVYPTGSKQEIITPKYEKFYKWADVIAGDFHFVRKYMPNDLAGKIIITNTVTAKNVDELRERGVRTLITTTPELEGRSFGTNVMEATLVAWSGKRPDVLTEADYNALLDRLQFKPRIQDLQPR